ncbi:MAG: hypothetical protein JNM34_01065 [Chthonomonadaceae bacterium]|nr:hypothetical protein [Chthonomonadaceae bacterium]
MQDRYAGDVGDFSKFQLLRAVSRMSGAPLGLSWYLFPDEEHNSDGRHLAYLDKLEYKASEPELIQALSQIPKQGRSVTNLERAGILPDTTLFFTEQIPRKGGSERASWFDRSRQALSSAQVIMADPDNGFVPPSVTPGSSKYGKYIVDGEVADLLEISPLVIVYHHFCRTGTHQAQTRELIYRCDKRLDCRPPLALRFRPYSPRLYVLLAKNGWAEDLARSVVKSLECHSPNHWKSSTTMFGGCA